MFIGMVNSSGVWDARHDIYGFSTAEAITAHGAIVLSGLFSDIQNLKSEIR
jgi:hypothetical protein